MSGLTYEESSFWNTITWGLGMWNPCQKHAKLEEEGKPRWYKKAQVPQPLFVKARAFMKVVKRGDAFLI